MAFGGGSGFSPPPGEPHADIEHYFAQIHAEIEELFEGVFDSLEAESTLQLPVYTDATRPAAGTAGRVIFNSTDGQLNIDDGTNWTLPDGTTT